MKNKGLFQYLVLGMFLALGFLTMWLAVDVVTLETSRMIALKDYSGERLSFRADGTALIVHHEASGAMHCSDLRGVSVTIPGDESLGWLGGTQLPLFLPWKKEDSDWETRARFFTDGRRPFAVWYFITDGRPNGAAYFVGYDSHSKAKIGYLGIAGFRAEMPPPEERFPFGGSTSAGTRGRVFCPGQDNWTRPMEGSSLIPSIVYVLGLDQKIYEADLRKRTVRIAFHEQGIRSFNIYNMTRQDPSNISWRLAVRTDRDVLMLDKHGDEQQRYPIPSELQVRPFTFGETTVGEAVMYENNEYDLMDTEVVYRLFWVRPDGHSRTAAVTLPHDSGMQSLRYSAAALIPSPLMLDVAGIVRSREIQEDGLTPTFSSALIRTATEFWPARVIGQLLALAFAVLCYRRQVRYGVNRAERIVWPLFVLLLGLPGWIGYRFGRSWPVLESCPACGGVVPRDRGDCARCAAEFPLPALKGTEVFA